MRSVFAFFVFVFVISSIQGCCDGSDSPDRGPPPPSNLLVYISEESSQLYKLDSLGTATLLSDLDGAQGVYSGFAVSQDRQRVAFAYRLDGERMALAIKRIADNVQEEPASDAMAGFPWNVQWLPDSRGALYTIRDNAADNSALLLSAPGEAVLTELLGGSLGAGARFAVSPSADGSVLAVAAEYFSSADDPTPNSAALYLVDPEGEADPLLVATASGDANAFKLAWSPNAAELAWQRRLVTDVVSIGIPNNHPVGPLMLANATGDSRSLRNIDDDAGWTPWVWLDGIGILVTNYHRGFELVATDGSLVTTHATAGNGGVVVSPDGRQLAFIALADGSGLAVHALELDSLEYRELGPASSYHVISGISDESVLRWSPDGERLVWQRETDRPNRLGELYVHEFGSGETHLVTSQLALYDTFRANWFGWLPGGELVDYVARVDGGFELAVARPGSDRADRVGRLASTFCSVLRVWRSDVEVLWNDCGADIRLSTQRKDGTFSDIQVYEGDAFYIELTANRALAVLQAAQGGDATTAPSTDWTLPWQVWDFGAGSLRPLAGTEGTSCCGTLLQ